MKVYLLYYDTNYGDREEWNTFHTPCEVFDSAEKRQARIDFIRAQVDQDGEPVEYEFEEVDYDFMSDAEIQKWSE